MRMFISTTLIEQFNKFINYDGSEDNFLAALTGQVSPSPYMNGGTAINEFINNPTAYLKSSDGNVVNIRGLTFRYSDLVRIVQSVDYRMPIFEVKQMKSYEILNEEIYVTAKVDQLCGYHIFEYKTAWTDWDSVNNKPRSIIEEYNKSVQHIFYGDIFNASSVNYLIYKFNGLAPPIELTDIMTSQHVTNKKDSEIIISTVLTEFIDYITKKGLESHVTKPKAILPEYS